MPDDLRTQIAAALAAHPLLSDLYSADTETYLAGGEADAVLAVVQPVIDAARADAMDARRVAEARVPRHDHEQVQQDLALAERERDSVWLQARVDLAGALGVGGFGDAASWPTLLDQVRQAQARLTALRIATTPAAPEEIAQAVLGERRGELLRGDT